MQFSLQSLLAAMAFAALSLWAWRSYGYLGVAAFVVFVTIVVANLCVALLGAKLRCPVFAGAFGGALLWSLAAVGISVLEQFSLLREFGFNEQSGTTSQLVFLWFEDSLVFTFVGALVGLVCGVYAKLKHRQVRTTLRKGPVYGVTFTLTIIFCIWMVLKIERARAQRAAVACALKSGGQVRFDYEDINYGGPPGPEWLRKYIGIDYFADVVSLTGGQVSDVTPLAGLRSVTSLDLGGSLVTDVSALAELRTLEQLELSGTAVNDVRPLAGLTSLTSLNLDGTQVNDVVPLSTLRSLERLSLSRTEVSDLSPLVHLDRLAWLTLDGTLVNDVTPLTKLRNLRGLRLSGTQVTDLSPLSGLNGLWTLQLDGTLVSDLSPLSELWNLNHLNLRGTQLSDLSPLAGFTPNFTELDLGDTHVTDLSPLADLRLDWLSVANTGVSDISALASLSNLRRLNLESTQITDVSPLAELTHLNWLSLADTAVSDLTPLAGLSSLRRLNLDGTQVTDATLEQLQQALPHCIINR